MRKVAPSADFERRDGLPGAVLLAEVMSGGFGSIEDVDFRTGEVETIGHV